MDINVTIPIEDFLKLDGNCSERTQHQINDYKSHTNQLQIETPHAWLKAVVAHIIKVGFFRAKMANIEVCLVCGKKAGYKKHKVGMLKGEDNYRRPLKFQGLNFIYTNDRRVTGQVCLDCESKHQFEEQVKGFISKNNLNIKIYANGRRNNRFVEKNQ